ncbi:diacylglycerol/lipid kinase family protein [Dokdonia sp. Hel_I_53]|uniref:diacylglycerol/lipid kinase family protein n=1 Tax=Dokdonia sp. Hel_I_53 TaxID=1566287 RepID=UPI00119A51E3|nr:diacylglycerol kinase family protein [Dokdonia sp. Hel_I_53]TVZ52843.1 YegS/Rv2252/BmrU family lipid kinase [Dokdonia sp. Hel_I_53]
MEKDLLLVINPTAGSIDYNLILSTAQAFAKLYDFKLNIYTTSGDDDAEDIKKLLRETNYDRVVVAGGDGTIRMVAKLLLHSDLILGILASGSANGLATSLEYPTELDAQFEIAFNGESKPIDTIVVNDKLCTHIADIGINAELIYNYDKSGSSGLLGYASQVLPTVYNSDYPFKFNISVNNQTINTEGILVAFANGKKYGTGSIINPKGKINDGKFEVIVFKTLGVKQIFKTFFEGLRIGDEHFEMYHTTSVSIECNDKIALQIDGEYIGKYSSIKATVNPASLLLAMPNS